MFQKVVDLKVFTDIGHFTFMSFSTDGNGDSREPSLCNEFEQ
jgi:hypothetical protein